MNKKLSIGRRGLFIGFALFLTLVRVIPVGAQMAGESNYCSVPPFLASSQAWPNVMIMLDNSGSMNDHPFSGDYNPTLYSSGYYFGYFDPSKMYKYNSSSKMWQIYSGSDPGVTYTDAAQPIASGNFLNWAVTRKLEVAKKLLVGGNPGYVGTTVNPRTVTAPSTIKLYTEDDGSSNNVTFDNSMAFPLVTSPSWTAPYLVPGYSNVIYPFNGKITYKLAAGGCSTGPACSKLSLTTSDTGTTTVTLYPKDDISVASNWKRYNNLTTSTAGSYYTYVDETAQDGDATTIANRVDTNPIIFDYGPNTADLSGQAIQDVNLLVTARVVDGSSGACAVNSYSSGCYVTTGKDSSGCYIATSATGGCYLSGSGNNTCNDTSCSWNSGSSYCRSSQCQVKKSDNTCSARSSFSGACAFQNINGHSECAPVTCNGSDSGSSCGWDNSKIECRSSLCQISGSTLGNCSDNSTGAGCDWLTIGSTNECVPTVDVCNGAGCSFNSSSNCSSNQCTINHTTNACSDVVANAKCGWQTVNMISQCVPGGANAPTIPSRGIQGVLSMGTGGTTTIASTFVNLNNASSNYNQYATYTFTWTTNPVTGQPWTLADIKSGASTTSLLNGFGVQNYGASVYSGGTVSCYVDITKVSLYIDATNPIGGPYSLVVDTGQQSITGMLDTLSSGVRFGMSTYGDSSSGAKVLSPVDFSNMDSIAKQAILIKATNNTPLAESEYELLNYFRQVSPKYHTNDYVASKASYSDPYYYMYSHLTSHGTSTANDIYVPCAKSYILLLTDGEPTSDNITTTDLPTPLSYWPTGTTANKFETSSYLDDLALWGRTEDMRPGNCSDSKTSWPCMPTPPNQNVVTYPIYLFGKGSKLLKRTALNGGFTGLAQNPNPPSNVYIPPCLDPNDLTQLKPGYTQDDLKHCFRFSDTNKSGTINPIDPWGTGDDPPITYYEGSDAYALQTSLITAIADMMKRSASGTAVSVLTTSSRGVGSMLQAYFLPVRQEGLRQVTWTGYAQNLWLYDELREDTVADQRLIMGQDNVIKMYLDPGTTETMAAKFTTLDDGTGGGLASCTTPTAAPFSEINYLWEAGQKLGVKRPSDRKIFTANNVIRSGPTTTTYTFTFSMNNFSWPLSDAAFNSALNPDATYTAENIVRYVRGECLETNDGSGNYVTGDDACSGTPNGTFRDRRLTVLDKTGLNIGDANGNVWKLGDIITSTPQVLGSKPINGYYDMYQDSTYYNFYNTDNYKQRTSVAFIGANDGMLHAFKVGYLKSQDSDMQSSNPEIWALFKNSIGASDSTHDEVGEELWSYIPFNAFPYLKYLADPNYCHIYYNDLPVNLNDVSLGGASNPNPTDAKTSDSWRTILIGSMRFGGCGGVMPQYPPGGSGASVGFSAYYAIDVTDAENPVPLWEFSDSDLGYATSYPGIIRTGDSSPDHHSLNGNWYVVFGSGSTKLPSNTIDIDRSSTGYVYILNLKTGALVKKIALDHNAIVSDILVVDANMDYLSEKLYLGTAYNSSGWKGKLVSIDIPNQDLSSWTPQIHYLFTGNTPFTAKPDAGLDGDYKTWVFAGSGKYFSNLDGGDTTQQIFLGFKDSGILSPMTIGNLDNRTNTTTTGTVKSTTQICSYDTTTNPGTGLPIGFHFQTVVTAVTTTISTAPSTTGWYLNLATYPSGERVISRPTVFGGLVDFLSYIPNGDPCNAGGNSYLYSVGFSTGTAPSTVSIYNPGATSGTSGNVSVSKGVLMGAGTPPTGESIILTPKTGNENTLSKKVQVSTGVIIDITDNPPMDTTSRILHWLRK